MPLQTNKEEGSSGIDKYKSSTAQNKTISEVTETDKTKTKIAANYNETVNMFNQQPVDNVLLKNNHVDSQTNVERQNARAQRSVANDDKEKGIAPVNNKKIKETNVLSEGLWTKMMNETDKHKTSMKDTMFVNNSLVEKQRDSIPLKSPGEKLDKVIKRIREEKENKVSEKANDRSARIKNKDSSFKMPELDKSLNKKDLGNHLLKNKNTMPGGKIDWNYNSLQQAGLVVGLDLPQDKTVLPKQVALKPVSQSAKHTDSLMFSPPRQIQDDAGTDVSPTATSMSSDVFLVKAKELDRRMKLRAEMSHRLASQTEMSQRLASSQTENQRVNVGKNRDTHIGPQGMAPRKTKTNISNKMDLPQTVKTQVTVQNKGNWISKLPEKASEKVEECTRIRQSQGTDKTTKTKTSAEKIDAVIDDVIKSAAALGDEKECSQNKISSQNIKSSQSIFSQNTGVMKKVANQVPYISDETNDPLSCQVPGSQMVLVKSQGQSYALPLQAIHMKVVKSGSTVPGSSKMAGVDSTQDILGNSQVLELFETQANTTQVSLNLFSFLARLSQRLILIGELIGYPWSGVCCRRHQQFEMSSPPKPLDQSKPNFTWSLLRKGEQNFI